MMNRPLMLSSGEFAKICHISRELLIHYDRIGLLKPKEIKSNGYRYYSVKQLYIFDAIRFLLDAGMSTKEVKEYLSSRTTDLFLENIQGLVGNLREQRAILDSKIGMMEKLRYITERSLLFPKDEPRLSFWDELYMIVTDIPAVSEQAYIQAMSDHSEFCRDVAQVSKFPLGRIVKKLNVPKEGQVIGQQIMTWISPPADDELLGERLAIKKKGNYAVILHQGGWDTIASSYTKLLKYIEENKLVAHGPAYELDMNTYLVSRSEEDYLIHISILVE
ncbi:MAG: MerR family transcriptional regulator [Coriobacteriaceae bacterium]|nr:MerR family transcriptional regulator [Coriobacteriaceae bacterium]